MSQWIIRSIYEIRMDLSNLPSYWIIIRLEPYRHRSTNCGDFQVYVLSSNGPLSFENISVQDFTSCLRFMPTYLTYLLTNRFNKIPSHFARLKINPFCPICAKKSAISYLYISMAFWDQKRASHNFRRMFMIS